MISAGDIERLEGLLAEAQARVGTKTDMGGSIVECDLHCIHNMAWVVAALEAAPALLAMTRDLADRLADAQRCIEHQEKQIRTLAEQREIAYVTGRRDGLAVGAHRDALIADVLRETEAYAAGGYEGSDACDRALRAWIRAGRPGLAREGGECVPAARTGAAVTGLDEIKRALDAATPGPWTTSGLRGLVHVERDDTREHIASLQRARAADAILIANAPSWLRDLVAEVERLRANEAALLGELRDIARISEPGHAWPHDRVVRFLATETRDD